MCSSAFYNLPQPHTPISLTRPAPLPAPRVTLPTTRPRLGPIRAGSMESARLEPAATFYELLGIAKDVTLGEIKQAYKQMARKYHPDVSPPGRVEEYTERFLRVQEAYQTLSDPRRRAMYDGDMAKGFNLPFAARRRYNAADEEMEDKHEWKNRWQGQLEELKRRSTYKNAQRNIQWSAKMRRQKND